MKHFQFFTLVIFTIGYLIPCHAVIITTNDGVGADAFIFSATPDVNFGTNESLILKHDTALSGNNRKAYVRFDLTSVSTPISNASFDLTYAGFVSDPTLPNAVPSSYSVYGLNDGHLGENWLESDITWNNAPGNNTTSAGGVIASDTDSLGDFILSISTNIVGDILSFSSSSLVNFLNMDTDGLVTLLIVRQETNFGNELFSAKENTLLAAPSLNLDLVDNPPPSVPETPILGLFGVGFLGFSFSCRKRLFSN